MMFLMSRFNLDAGDIVRMQPIRTGEREWKEATVKRAFMS